MQYFRTAIAVAMLALCAPAAMAGWALDAMHGAWSERPSCDSPGRWDVFGDRIQFAWPGRPVDVERVISERDNTIETIGVSPEIMGRRYTYVVGFDRQSVLIVDHSQGTEELVRRC